MSDDRRTTEGAVNALLDELILAKHLVVTLEERIDAAEALALRAIEGRLG